MSNQQRKWLYLIVLSLVWGSSFILMKKALISISPIQVAALRTFFAAIFVILVGFKSLRKIKKRHWKYVFLSALVGTFFPAFLFAYAIKGIDSSIASILNSLTPFNTFIIGALVFGFAFNKKQFIGIFIGLIGTLILILKGADLNPNQNYWYALLPIISSVGYAFNVNIIKKYLHELDGLTITTGHFLLVIIPVIMILGYTGFFTEFELNIETKSALLYIIILSVLGTAMAKVIFNDLVHISSPIFASSVTYLIPIVAVIWGIIDGEKLGVIQLLAGGVILFGVWITNKAK
ncbi:DMT family transporter [Tenacibaculum soleae]|uniref:DMT family transporter n=1 Tax=Tenacibaculum soleae TaxID=447689 RepID=UPI0026E1316D|nr:DMT family transporter [Tenacibaculum soleae]MDO6743380.1 DMT family transporter [Tenacibaculum soleae]